MTSSNFLRCKANYLNEQEPFIVLSKEELVAERDNYYRIGETSIAVSSAVQNQLDKLIGLPRSNGRAWKKLSELMSLSAYGTALQWLTV